MIKLPAKCHSFISVGPWVLEDYLLQIIAIHGPDSYSYMLLILTSQHSMLYVKLKCSIRCFVSVIFSVSEFIRFCCQKEPR